jgi:RNA polymerase sigma factor (sigma-70 family)
MREIEQIVESVRAGDAGAFDGLVERYHGRALSYARTLVNHPQAAEDAVQEALVAAYRHLHKLRDPAAFEAWLRAIVRYQCARERRAGRATASADGLEELVSNEADLALTFGHKTLCEQIWSAVGRLPADERQVVRMFYAEGLSQQEIAARTQITVSAVNSRLHRARAGLRRRLIPMSEPQNLPGNPGTVVEGAGAVVTLQFAPGRTPALLSRLESGGHALCVCQQLTAGRVRAVTEDYQAIWTPGQEASDTGEPFLTALDSVIRHLSPAAFGAGKAGDTALATGIKTIDLFAPLTQGGSTAVVAEWGLGTLVLLPELLHNLEGDTARQAFFIFTQPVADTKQWGEVIAEMPAGMWALPIVYLPVSNPYAALPESLAGQFSTVLTLSRRLAEQAIWPCIDPLRSRSNGALPEGDSRRTDCAEAVRALLRQYYALQMETDAAERPLTPAEWLQVRRARKALRLLSQPFHVAEPYTGRPGVVASVEDAIESFNSIVEGRFDSQSVEAFYMVGAAPDAGQ